MPTEDSRCNCHALASASRHMPQFDPRLTPARPDLAAAQLRGLITAAAYVEGRPMQVVTGIADVRREPAHEALLDTQAIFGEAVTLYEDQEGWGWVQLARDGYVGYIAMAALAEGRMEPTHRVAVNRTFVYQCPDIKLPARRSSPLGAAVRIHALRGAFAQIGDCAFVFADHLKPFDAYEKDFVAVAEQFLHVPYLWGGKTSLGIDCSGLVQVALQAAGHACPRDSDMQEMALGKLSSLGELRRGDLCSGKVTSLSRATVRLCCTPMRIIWRWRSSRRPRQSRASRRRAAK